eukprot:gene49783-67601_t
MLLVLCACSNSGAGHSCSVGKRARGWLRGVCTMSALLNDVFMLHRRSLMGAAFRIVRDRQVAEELAQESYLRVRSAIEAGPIEHIEAFLHQTARNLALDHERRRKTRSRYEEASADPQA